MNTHVVQCPDCIGHGRTGSAFAAWDTTCVRCMGLGKVPAHDDVAEWVGWCPALHNFMEKVEGR